MGRPSGWSPPLLPAAWIYREENIHTGVWFLNCCCSPGGCGFSLSVVWASCHLENRVCPWAASPAEASLAADLCCVSFHRWNPSSSSSPASHPHMQCPSRVFPAPGCAAAAGWAAGCLLLRRLWGWTSPDTNTYWLVSSSTQITVFPFVETLVWGGGQGCLPSIP